MLTDLRAIPFSKEQIAVAVAHSHLGGGHIGLAFHSAKSGPCVLHLAWHKVLKADQIPQQLHACWAAFVPPLPKLASKQVVAFVRTVAARGAQINYGIDFISAQGSFLENGTYRPPRGSTGLTCASFVVEVLRSASIKLVKEETWQANPANEEWGNEVCYLLHTTGADADHVEAVRSTVNGLRLRPFEVAGAASLSEKHRPAAFEEVQGPAKVVAENLPVICPPT
jgi:hypothetical protein